MKPLRVLRYRLRALFHRSRLDEELDEEMRFHVEMLAREYEAAGHSPREARRRARLAFGGVERSKERTRDARGVRWLDDLVQDVRYGLRMLRRSPVFTAVAVTSLGLGIGANTAVFSLVDAILLRSLPVPHPEQLRVLDWTAVHQAMDISITGSYNHPEGARMAVGDAVSYPAFEAVRQRAVGRARVFGFTRLPDVTVQLPGAAFVAPGLMVTDDFFRGMEVGASLGRVFSPGEPEAEAAGQVVLSHDVWAARFGGDPGVLGRTVTLNGQPFTVIGVLPPGFRGLHTGDTVQFYVTTAAQPAFMPGWSRTATDFWWVVMMARLAPGTSDEAFRAVAEAGFASAVEGIAQEPGLIVHDGRAGLKGPRDTYRRPLMILLVIVGVVILVACANLAGLSLARGAAREHEFAIRPALGAGRGRLLRQSLTESLLLGLLGGAVGVVVAAAGTSSLSGLLLDSSISLEGLEYDPALDLRVLGFTLGLAMLAGLLSGLLPALRAGGAPLSSLQGRRTVGAPRLGAGRVLIVGQMALSVLLLVGAGLYGRTLLNLVRIDPGFQADHLLLFRVSPEGAGYPEDRWTGFYDDVSRSLAAVPGVRGVTLSRIPLLSGWMSGGGFFTLPDHPSEGQDRPRANRHTVSESYFATMGIPVVMGRGFETTDVEGAAPVVVVNETFARSYLGPGTPLGQRMRVGDTDWTIVGVSGDVRYTGITDDIPATVYFSFRQSSMHDAVFALRTDVDPLTVVDEARAAVAAVDPAMPIAQVETQLQIRDGRIAQERMFAWLCGALAVLALMLCCIGLYGLMAYDVARRTGEIGVRVALGATRRGVAGPILWDAARLTGAGLLVGLPAALLVVRLIRSQLYGVEPGDPASMAGGTVLLAGVALLAAWFPARRATRIDPADALRAE